MKTAHSIFGFESSKSLVFNLLSNKDKLSVNGKSAPFKYQWTQLVVPGLLVNLSI